MGGVTRCSDHDHLLRCGQTVAPRYRVLKAFQCMSHLVSTLFNLMSTHAHIIGAHLVLLRLFMLLKSKWYDQKIPQSYTPDQPMAL